MTFNFFKSVPAVLVLLLLSFLADSQTCSPVKFNNITASSPYNCSQKLTLSALDSLQDNGISPGFTIFIQRDQNSKNDNIIKFYVNGTLADTKYPPNDNTNQRWFASHLNNNSTYRIDWYDNNIQGVYPWTLYDHAGNVIIKSGVFNFPAENKKFLSISFSKLKGISKYTGVGVTDNANGTGVFNPALSGPGIFDITYSWDDENGCRGTYTQTITVVGPKASAGNDISVCRGTPVQIGGTPTGSGGAGNFKYVWSPKSGLSSSSVSNPNAAPFSSTSYIVTVTDFQGKGCKAIDTINVTIKNNPEARAGKDTSICKGNNITLSAGGGGEYRWSNDETTAEINVSPEESTSYIVTITDTNNCTASDTVKIDVYPMPEAVFESKPGDEAFKFVFTNNSSGAKNFTWKFGDGTTSSDKQPEHIYKDGKGKHIVTLIVDNGAPDYCTDSISHEVIGSEIKMIPDVFTPEAEKNRKFVMEANGIESIDIQIFNRWGVKIFTKSSIEYEASSTGGSANIILWEGNTKSGTKADAGTYFYVIKATGVDTKTYNENGSITIIK